MSASIKEILQNPQQVIRSASDYFSTRHSLDQIDDTTLLRWGCIVFLALLLLFWHSRQNRAFTAYLDNSKKHSAISRQLSLLARNRSMEVLLLFMTLLLAFIFYDTRVDRLQEQIVTEQAHAVMKDILAAQDAAEKEDLRLQLQAAKQFTGLDESKQQELDIIKQEFEGLFINYYLLKQCSRTVPEDFHIMHSALLYRLALIGAPASSRQNILDAASGSFQELYATQECDSEAVGAAEKSTRDYLDTVVQNLPDR